MTLLGAAVFSLAPRQVLSAVQSALEPNFSADWAENTDIRLVLAARNTSGHTIEILPGGGSLVVDLLHEDEQRRLLLDEDLFAESLQARTSRVRRQALPVSFVPDQPRLLLERSLPWPPEAPARDRGPFTLAISLTLRPLSAAETSTLLTQQVRLQAAPGRP